MKRTTDILVICAVLLLCVAWMLDSMVLLGVAGVVTVAAFVALVTTDPREWK